MSHIVNFSISGLAGRDGTYSQTLNRDVNIFFGSNGSGKTSLLKILHSAMSNDVRILRGVAFDSAEVTIHTVAYNIDFVARLRKADLQVRRKPSKPRDRSLVTASDIIPTPPLEKETGDWQFSHDLPKGSSKRWAHRYLPTWRLYTNDPHSIRTTTSYQTHSTDSYDWDLIFARGLEELWTRFSALVLGEVQKVQSAGLVSILKGLLSTEKVRGRKQKKTDPTKAFESVSEFLSRQQSSGLLGTPQTFARRYQQDSQFRTVVDDINTIEERIASANAPRTKLEQLIREMFSGNKQIIFKDSEINVVTSADNQIGLAALSSGEKQMLGLLIEALLADISSLIIDEPEISLHIDWQRRLVAAMQQLNAKAQLIFATHSPEVMADVPDAKIFRL